MRPVAIIDPAVENDGQIYELQIMCGKEAPEAAQLAAAECRTRKVFQMHPHTWAKIPGDRQKLFEIRRVIDWQTAEKRETPENHT